MSMGSRAATGWERFFWAVFNKSTNPMSLLDEQRVRVAVNAALCEFLQRPRAALVGGRIDEIVRPNELKSLAAEWDRFMRVGDWTGDREVIRADGVAIRAQYAGRAAEIDGRRLVVFVIVPGEIDVIPENGVSAELTPRERSVLHLITLGLTSAQIAERLSISVSTVQTHVGNAMAKTGAKTRAQLVAIALAERHTEGVKHDGGQRAPEG